MASEPRGEQGALLGLAHSLTAGESRQITTGLGAAAGSACLPSKPEQLDIYWPEYLRRLQLAGPPAAAGASLAAAPAASATAAAAAHAQLLQALGGHKGAPIAAPAPSGLAGSSIGNGGLAAPRAIRPQDSHAPMQLADLAMALKKQAAAPMPGTSGASAFSQPAANGWGNDGGSSGGGGSSTPDRTANMRRQGSNGLRRGSSGSLPSSLRGTPAGPATSKRSSKRAARDTLASEALPFKKRVDANRAAAAAAAGDDGSDSAEEGAEMALVRMRSGEAPLVLPATDELGKDDETPTAGGPKCSKEKNRQAQRRFRERQKTLIGDLRENVRLLDAEVGSQNKQIFVLQEENRLLKLLLGERQTMTSGQPSSQQPQQQTL